MQLAVQKIQFYQSLTMPQWLAELLTRHAFGRFERPWIMLERRVSKLALIMRMRSRYPKWVSSQGGYSGLGEGAGSGVIGVTWA